MRKLTLPLLCLLLLGQTLAASQPALARQAGPGPAEPASGSVICVPDVYENTPDECQPYGPSEFLLRQSGLGIPYPPLPLPAYTPSGSLNQVPYLYYRVNDSGTRLFSSMGDAIANQGAVGSLYPGLLYVSYIERVETEQGKYYQLRSGLWIRSDGARAAVPVFQGLAFSSPPATSFGWVLGEVPSRSAPGFSAPETGRTWYRYNVVQIYAIQEAENNTWLLVGPDEWLDYRHVARVDPKDGPPEGLPASRWIEVNLDEQTVAVYQDNQLVFATLVSSGVDDFWTRPGIFEIYEKKDIETMSGYTEADRSDYYYLEDVPWTMYYDERRAFHGAYWHNFFGYKKSHGCVNMSIGDSHWLYEWASLGDYVYVYDPSGHTPTDPSLFGTGSP